MEMKDKTQMIKNIGLVFILLFSLLVGGCGQSEQTASQPQAPTSSQFESNSVSSQPQEEQSLHTDVLKDMANDVVFLATDTSCSNEYNRAINAYNKKIRNELFYSDWDEYCPDYAIYDITGDDVPELFLSINEAGIHKYVYTYRDGEVINIPANMGNGMHGSFYVYPNTIIYYHSTTGLIIFVTEIYKDGTAREFTFGRMMTGDPDTEHYDYNGQKVTEDEYEKQWERYKHLTRDNAVKLDFYSIEEVLKENSPRFRDYISQ